MFVSFLLLSVLLESYICPVERVYSRNKYQKGNIPVVLTEIDILMNHPVVRQGLGD